jgi:hypothetical protein
LGKIAGAMKSSSSAVDISIAQKAREAVTLARMHLAKRFVEVDCHEFEDNLVEYDTVLRRYGARSLSGARIVEIGFGARPIRLAWLRSAGLDVRGMDRDAPILKLDVGQLAELWRRNGPERALKSAARLMLVGDKEWRDARRAFQRAHPDRMFRIPTDRMVVGSAAEPATWDAMGMADFVYSEDVFEHMPPDELPGVVDCMASHLAKDAVAFIRLQMFTGIAGGHSVDWYRTTLETLPRRSSEPWDHLRANRFPANTYLNRWRYRDYVSLFERRYEILETIDSSPGLGARFLTPEIEAELSGYSREELMMNYVGFVLRKKRAD